MTRKSNLCAISLFSGAGGMDYGFQASGFHTAAAVEIDPHCCSTLRENIHAAVIERDIREVPGRDLCAAAGRSPGEFDLLHGGPPCQPFSKAGYWSKGDTQRLDDPRASTLSEFMRIVEEIVPTAVVLENVHGINYSGKEEGLRLLFNCLDTINHKLGTSYDAHWSVLDAAEFGVPQHRKRFFLVAHRDGLPFQFPAPTHWSNAERGLFDLEQKPFMTAWDAIGDLCDDEHGEDLQIKGRWADLLPSIPEGENYLWHTSRKGGMNLFGWRTRYWSFLLKLAKSLPSWTIQAQPGPAIGPFHWNNRLLSSRELCRIQTFPDHVRLVGSRRVVQMQAGNAVPSLLSEVIGKALRQQWFGGTDSNGLKLLHQDRGTPPPPETPQPVPKQFWSLQGDHAEHPGTGKGKGALRRKREQSPA